MHTRVLTFILTVLLSVACTAWDVQASPGLNTPFIHSVSRKSMSIVQIGCWPRKPDACPWHKKLRHGHCVPCSY